MKTKTLVLAVLAILIALTGPACGESPFTVSPAALEHYAQATRVPPMALDSADGRKAADWTSSVIIGAQAGAALTKAATSGHAQTAAACLVARAALVAGATIGLKRLVHKERPDGSDRKSWPSGHTMWSVMLTDGTWSYAAPVVVAAGRILAGRHDLVDVASGGVIGEGIKRIPCGGPR